MYHTEERTQRANEHKRLSTLWIVRKPQTNCQWNVIAHPPSWQWTWRQTRLRATGDTVIRKMPSLPVCRALRHHLLEKSLTAVGRREISTSRCLSYNPSHKNMRDLNEMIRGSTVSSYENFLTAILCKAPTVINWWHSPAMADPRAVQMTEETRQAPECIQTETKMILL